MTLIKKADVQKHYSERRLTLVPGRHATRPDATGLSKDDAATSSAPRTLGSSSKVLSSSSTSIASTPRKTADGSAQG